MSAGVWRLVIALLCASVARAEVHVIVMRASLGDQDLLQAGVTYAGRERWHVFGGEPSWEWTTEPGLLEVRAVRANFATLRVTQEAVDGTWWRVQNNAGALEIVPCAPPVESGEGGELSIEAQVKLFFIGFGCALPFMLLAYVAQLARRAKQLDTAS